MGYIKTQHLWQYSKTAPTEGLVERSVVVGFKLEADRRVMSAFNVAMSYNKKQAVIGEYPDLSFDDSKVFSGIGNERITL